MKHHCTLSIALCSALLAACSGEYESEDEIVLGESEQAIRGGNLFTASNHVAPDTTVVKLDGCSGIKVSARRFLTAAHCFGSNAVGTTIRVTNQLDGDLNGANAVALTVNAVRQHPTFWNGVAAGKLGYDAAFVDVDESSNAIPSWSAYRSLYVSSGATLWLTAYGCDPLAANMWHGQKQYAPFLADARGVTEFDTYTIWARGDNPQSCPGDSGGPLFIKRDGAWEVAAVNESGLAADPQGNPGSAFIRLGNIRTWLADPRHNVAANGTRNFFVNRFSNKCISATDTASTPDTIQSYCDGRDAFDTRADKQYWRLVSNGSTDGVSNFRIQNTLTGRCLGAMTVGFVVNVSLMQQLACPTANDPRFSFQFPAANTGDYRLIKSASNRCVAAAGDTNGGLLTHGACNANSLAQSWILSK